MKRLNEKNNKILLSLMFLLCLLPIHAFATKMKAPAQISVQSNTTGNLLEILISIKLTQPVEKINVLVFNQGIENKPETISPLPSKQADEMQYRFVFNQDIYPQIDRLAIGIDFIQKNVKTHESLTVQIKPVETIKKNTVVIHPKNAEAAEIFIP
jgi:hypothetical protein